MTGKEGSEGAHQDGSLEEARFHYPYGIVRDSCSGVLFVCDSNNHCIRRIDEATNSVTTLAGSGRCLAGHADGQGMGAQFFIPAGITMDRDRNLIVADHSNRRICSVTLSGAVTTIVEGSAKGGIVGDGPCKARVHSPHDVELTPDGDIVVAEISHHCVCVIESQGTVAARLEEARKPPSWA